MTAMLFMKGVSPDSLQTICREECQDAPDTPQRARFRALWNEYERLRAAHDAQERNTFGVAFDTLKHPGYVHVVKVTLHEDVMTDADVVNIDLRGHRLYSSIEQYVKANSK